MLASISLSTYLSILSLGASCFLRSNKGRSIFGIMPSLLSIITLSINESLGADLSLSALSKGSLTVSYDIFLDTTIVPYNEKKSPSAMFSSTHCCNSSGA